MSGADVDRARAGVKEKAASEGKLDTAGKKAADAIVGSASGSAGIQFDHVEGDGDEARFALTVGAGDLHVTAGNLYFTASAYSGPGLPTPEKLTGGSILAPATQQHATTPPPPTQ